MKKISLIISTKNEMNNSFFKETINLALSFKNEIEIIAVDSYSLDGTADFLKEFNIKVVQTNSNSRGERLNIGANHASTNLLLFNHPRSLLTNDGLQGLIRISNQKKLWGGFRHRFDHKNLLLNFTSWYSNNVRAQIREIIYLDHCLFVSKDLYENCPFLAVDIFEDTLICQSLNKMTAPTLLNFSSTTSSIRFQKNGMIKQAIMNQVMKLGFMLKIDHKLMNKVYEFGINLNSKY